MKKLIITGILLVMYANSYSQNLDLLVTDFGDSNAFNMEIISDLDFNNQLNSHQKRIQTFKNQNNFDEINYDSINTSDNSFEKGAMIIDGYAAKTYPKRYPGKKYLETAPQDELNFYLGKAKRTKKTGMKMLIAGPLTSGAGILIASASYSGGTSGGFAVGYMMILAGIGTTVIGIPVFTTGTYRVGSLKKIMNYRDVTIELVPYYENNFQTQNYCYGTTLRIRL